MFGRQKAGSVNETVKAVVSYDVDPYGAGLVGALNARVAGVLNGARAVIDTHSPAFTGWAQAPQNFRGANGLGAVKAIREQSSELSKSNGTQSQITDPTLRIFAARMKQGL